MARHRKVKKVKRPKCGGCGRRAELHNGAHGSIWACWGCDMHVGCHPGTQKPLGSLAGRELRTLRRLVHERMDPIWESVAVTGGDTAKARGVVYLWLAGELGIKPEDTHVGQFGRKRCRQALKALARPEVTWRYVEAQVKARIWLNPRARPGVE